MRKDIKKYKEEYYLIRYVVCPCLNNEKVYFNNHGFNHLIRKKGIRRSLWDTKRRFKLLRYVQKVISAKYVQLEYRKTNHEFWAIIKTVDNIRIKVVVRKIVGGRLHFFSIFEIKN